MKNEKIFPIIDTDKILLRKLELDDAPDLFENFSSENLLRYYGMAPHQNIDETISLINNFDLNFHNEKVIRWAVELKEEKKVIGTCGFHSMNKTHKRAEIGYELNENYWRMGYGSFLITELLKYGFEELHLNRIEALVYPDNLPSQSLLEKIGFKKEGLLEEYCFFIGKAQDLQIFSFLKRNWDNISK